MIRIVSNLNISLLDKKKVYQYITLLRISWGYFIFVSQTTKIIQKAIHSTPMSTIQYKKCFLQKFLIVSIAFLKWLCKENA